MNCEQLRTSIQDWFGSEIDCQPSRDDGLVATIPIFKPNGDAIEVGLEPSASGLWRVTDLGETYAALYLSGIELAEDSVRVAEFNQIKHDHQILDDGEELSIQVDDDALVTGLFDFIHAIQSMLALQITIQTRQPQRNFTNVVTKFLAEEGVAFELTNRVQGRSGRWQFQFELNHRRPVTLMKALSVDAGSRALREAEQTVFEVGDIHLVRPFDPVIVLDDEDSRLEYWSPTVMQVFGNYEIPALRFNSDQAELREVARRHVKA